MQSLSELGLTSKQAEDITKTCRCSVCDGLLSLAWGGSFGLHDYIIRCGNDRAHVGYTKVKSFTQLYDDGEALPLPIANAIERRRKKMPIKNLTERRRIPRLGKIHLGEKVKGGTKAEYPRATPYLVVPPEVAQVHGEKPTSLPIMFPLNDPGVIASQWYRCYTQTRGLICKGDGESATALVDVRTGEIATAEATQTELREITCDPSECVKAQKKHCRPVMCLQFMLPQVPGFGIWQIDTSSINSILNINTSLDVIAKVFGHIDLLPLLLLLQPQEVQADDKKKTVHVLNLSIPGTLAEMMRQPEHKELTSPTPAPISLPPPDDERPDDLFPDALVVEGEAVEVPVEQPLPRLEESSRPEPIAPPVGERLDPNKEKNRIYGNILETLQLHGRLSREGAVNWLLKLCGVKEAKDISLDQLITAWDKAKAEYQEG
jgi:hypothetical protein